MIKLPEYCDNSSTISSGVHFLSLNIIIPYVKFMQM